MSAGIIDGNVGAIFLVNATLNPASVAANTTAEQTFTVNGVRADDVVVSVSKPSLTAGLAVAGWRVSAANTVAIVFDNPTAGALDPGSEVYKMVIMRPDSDLVGGLP